MRINVRCLNPSISRSILGLQGVTRGMDLSPIRCLESVALILYFGQQVAVAIWNLTWNLSPFGMRMIPLDFNSEETYSAQGHIYSVEGIWYNYIAWRSEHTFGPGYHTLYM
jgi:hypothetical protein